MDSVSIEVSAADISAGCQGDAHQCPVALAMGRAFPGVEVIVTPLHSLLCHPNVALNHKVLHPGEAISFIHDFDSLKSVKPFSFEVDVDPEWMGRVPKGEGIAA